MSSAHTHKQRGKRRARTSARGERIRVRTASDRVRGAAEDFGNRRKPRVGVGPAGEIEQSLGPERDIERVEPLPDGEKAILCGD
jgi:hypothetical protein